MLDMEYLKRCGVSSAQWKPVFTLEPAERKEKYPRADKLVERIGDRIRQHREQNLRDHLIYAAIDYAYSVPFRQTTATLVQSLLSKKMSADETLKALQKYGLSEKDLFLDVPNPQKPTEMVKRLNPPVFFQILIPVVKAYTTIRAAKLFNDRNTLPLLNYNPLKYTERNRVICEVVTDLVETISTRYGYSEVLKDAITHSLKYGVMLAFTREEWDCEYQRGEEGRYVVKEGLRYILPHPTRMYYDMQYPLTTVNSDSGTAYMGHWQVIRYGDVLDNRKFWNRRKIAIGTNWFAQEYVGNYFAEIYPCRLTFPTAAPKEETREDRIAFYSNNNRDQACFLTNHFERIVPKDWDLGDYEYPIWVRFIMAGEDTVVFASPCAYTPAWFIGCDYDGQAARQSSFALEAIPFQDQLGNILSQMVLTAKQNLGQVTFYDTNVVEKKDVEALKNLGENQYRSRNYIPFDSMKAQRMGIKASEAFQSPDLRYQDISQLVTVMSNCLNLMERVLQMSAQEVGAAAQHYQSAQEIGVTQTASTNRIAFTGSFVDSGIQGWKRQIYDASQAYADTDIEAQVSADIPKLQKILADLGFEADFPGRPKVTVRGKRTALRIEGFASNAPGSPRTQNQQLAQIIYQTVAAVSQNPELTQSVGAENLLRLLEDAAKLSGAGNDFKLSEATQQNGAGAAHVAQALAMLRQQIMEEVAKPAAESAAKQEAEIQQLQGTVQQLMGIFELAKKLTDKNDIKAQETVQKMQMQSAEFQAESQRKEEEHAAAMRHKEEEHQLEMRRREEEHQQELKATEEKAQLSAAVTAADTTVDLEAKRKKTDADIEAINKKAEASAAATKKKSKSAAKK